MRETPILVPVLGREGGSNQGHKAFFYIELGNKIGSCVGVEAAKNVP